MSHGIVESWLRSNPPFAPALCEPVIAACARHLGECKRGSWIADVGCGTGSMLTALSDAGHRTVGIDADPTVAGTRPPDARLVLGDGERLPLMTDSVDAIFVFSAFQYMDRHRALSECSRVLKPGGRFAIVENLAGNPLAKIDRARRKIRRMPLPRHHLPWKDRAVYERYFSEVAYEAHHVLTPLVLLAKEPWSRIVLTTLRLLQRLERRVLSAGAFRTMAWHLVVLGRK